MYFNLIFIFLLSFLITLISIIILLPVARKLKLVDIPSKRKSHLGNVPLIGGLSILMGVYVSSSGSLIEHNIFLIYMVSAFFILILGLIDDFYPLSPKVKLAIQTLIILITLELTGLKFDTLGHSFGLKTQINLGFFAYPVTILGMLLVTNAFNLMDGADGVTGILAILALSVIFLIEILSLNINSNPLTLALIGSLIPFLNFNLIKSKNKIFLGDSGSLFLGFSISFLLLYETQVNRSISPPFALWILAIPIFDVCAVMIFRFKNSRSLFKPDRSHLHHFLKKLGLNNIQVVLSILGLGSLFLLLGLFIESHFRSLSFPIFLLLLFLYIWLRSYSKFSRYNS
jgi:UDP-GlcNAc:undecaprenyl-phosphate GlcNAc-1-phosphate transferase